MRNQYLLGLGGALLATTALSGAASAATVYGAITITAGATTVNSTSAALTAPKIAAQLFGTGGIVAASTIGPQILTVMFTNAYNSAIAPKILLTVTGANFATSSLGASATNIKLLSQTGATASTVTKIISGNTAGCQVGVLSSQIQITSCNNTSVTGGASYTISGVQLSGLIYTAATGLSTAGATITVGGSIVEAANPSNTFEPITSVTAVTSANSATATVVTTNASVNGGATVPFGAVTSQAVTLAGTLTVVLAQIDITGTGTVDATFTAVSNANMVGNLALTVTSAALSDPAVTNVRFIHNTGTAYVATAAVTAGSVTFPASVLTSAVLYGTAGGTAEGTNSVTIEYNGTTAITGGVAGTTSGTFSAVGGTYVGALPALSGATAAVSRATATADINSVQNSANTAATSYIRLVNTGTSAGAASIVVYNASTGAVLGTYTTASIPGKGTLQFAAKDIETALSITPTAGSSYNLNVSAPVSGLYAQHISGAPGNLFFDLSGKR